MAIALIQGDNTALSLRLGCMKRPESSLSIEETRGLRKDDFLRKLRANRGYRRLAEIRKFNERILPLLEKSCWLQHVAAVKSEMRGARAKAALRRLDRFVSSLGGGLWLCDAIVESLDDLRHDLERLASKARRGRPADPVAKLFRRNMKVFVPPADALQRSRRATSQDEIDEILADISAVVFRRRVSVPSFTRMRKRDR
jgi:hypothetical protein